MANKLQTVSIDFFQVVALGVVPMRIPPHKK